VVGIEASLDIQMMTSVAVNAQLTFFMQQAWMYTFTTDLLSLGTAAPLVVSVSYGWNEDQECSDILHDLKVCTQHKWSTQQYVNNTDLQLVKFGATGRSFLSSSGDQGAPGDQNVDCSLDSKLALYPMYPACSPWVTAVGATSVSGSKPGPLGPLPHRGPIKAPCGGQTPQLNCTEGPFGGIAEVPCMLANADFTTGGGFSQLIPMQSWQAAAVQAYLKSNITLPPSTKFNATNRGYPDVSACGQNIMIVSQSSWYVTGGTSASSPIMAGITTLLNNWLLNNNKPAIGPLNPLLYKIAQVQPNVFNKITTGDNKCTEDSCCQYGYLENPTGGWSPVTGLGTVNFERLLAYVQQNL